MSVAESVVNVAQRLTGLTGRSRRRTGTDNNPSQALFGRIRWQLTLWYSAVLSGALLVSGIVLYLAVQQSMSAPVVQTLQVFSSGLGSSWVNNEPVTNPTDACPINFHDAPVGLAVACFDPSGRLLNQNYNAALIPGFNSGSFSSGSVRSGGSSDLINTPLKGPYSAIQRYAASEGIQKPGDLGVLVVGLPFGTQISTLDTLLHLLLLLGFLTLVFSAAAGLFLANRALQPAKLAYARQRDFIADASHELRTPLTMLRSTVEFVLRGSNHLPPDDVALLEDAVLETAHITNLANNMLSLARLESDDNHIEEDVVDLGDMARQVVSWADSLASERRVRIKTHLEESVLVIGDRSLIEQATLILLDNAIKYNRSDGEVLLRVLKEHEKAILEVIDTGIGIAREHLARLGERFYRVDKARSRESGGAGLGLSIVRSIAARHDGSFDLSSEEGRGTTARLTLVAVETRGTGARTSEEAASSH
jgi:signal transduction histidine kinase